MSTPASIDIDIRAKRFDERLVLSDVHLSVRAGEIVTLVGASGCGKSTLLRIAAGLDRRFDGQVTLDGRALSGMTREIGFIFQEPRLFPWLSVAENVAFDLGRRGRDDPRIAPLLAEVGLTGYERALPKQLSGGQAQRVAIARGLFTQPRLLLLDEPFSAVDAFTRMKLQDLLVGLAQRHGITLLIVTHDIDEAAYLSDRVVVLGAQPGRVRDVVAVPSPRPRQRNDAALADARARLLDALHSVQAI